MALEHLAVEDDCFRERGSRELLERERESKLCYVFRGGGRFYTPLPRWCFPPCPSRVGEVFLFLPG
jgi:hypothetical protein